MANIDVFDAVLARGLGRGAAYAGMLQRMCSYLPTGADRYCFARTCKAFWNACAPDHKVHLFTGLPGATLPATMGQIVLLVSDGAVGDSCAGTAAWAEQLPLENLNVTDGGVCFTALARLNFISWPHCMWLLVHHDLYEHAKHTLECDVGSNRRCAVDLNAFKSKQMLHLFGRFNMISYRLVEESAMPFLHWEWILTRAGGTGDTDTMLYWTDLPVYDQGHTLGRYIADFKKRDDHAFEDWIVNVLNTLNASVPLMMAFMAGVEEFLDDSYMTERLCGKLTKRQHMACLATSVVNCRCPTSSYTTRIKRRKLLL